MRAWEARALPLGDTRVEQHGSTVRPKLFPSADQIRERTRGILKTVRNPLQLRMQRTSRSSCLPPDCRALKERTLNSPYGENVDVKVFGNLNRVQTKEGERPTRPGGKNPSQSRNFDNRTRHHPNGRNGAGYHLWACQLAQECRCPGIEYGCGISPHYSSLPQMIVGGEIPNPSSIPFHSRKVWGCSGVPKRCEFTRLQQRR